MCHSKLLRYICGHIDEVDFEQCELDLAGHPPPDSPSPSPQVPPSPVLRSREPEDDGDADDVGGHEQVECIWLRETVEDIGLYCPYCWGGGY